MEACLESREEMSFRLSEKMRRMYISPKDYFREKTDLYSVFDIVGVPTHDASGKELSKSTIKKLKKEWEKQEKLYNSTKD